MTSTLDTLSTKLSGALMYVVGLVSAELKLTSSPDNLRVLQPNNMFLCNSITDSMAVAAHFKIN